jgi:hypothetical protein
MGIGFEREHNKICHWEGLMRERVYGIASIVYRLALLSACGGCGGGGGDNGDGDIGILTARSGFGSPEVSAYINQ